MAELFVDVRKLKAAEREYDREPIDVLVIVAAYQLKKMKQALNFENIVASSFTLFPRRFQLRGFPEWPDASIVASSWRRCRDRHGWLTGSTKAGFQLTDLGRTRAEAFWEQDCGCTAGRGRQCTLDRRGEEMLKEFRRSEAFRLWSSTGRFAEHPSEILLALHCTTCADRRTKEQRLRELSRYACLAGDEAVLSALQAAVRQFGANFEESKTTAE